MIPNLGCSLNTWGRFFKSWCLSHMPEQINLNLGVGARRQNSLKLCTMTPVCGWRGEEPIYSKRYRGKGKKMASMCKGQDHQKINKNLKKKWRRLIIINTHVTRLSGTRVKQWINGKRLWDWVKKICTEPSFACHNKLSYFKEHLYSKSENRRSKMEDVIWGWVTLGIAPPLCKLLVSQLQSQDLALSRGGSNAERNGEKGYELHKTQALRPMKCWCADISIF